ncbi:methyltransferase [Aliiglaciecola sp. CAU 1673]|uniref:tRNA1(Val) (adenine(37)-N6)-methyltransferase n=1 Tax=Aliiglaciecola sp. CAU 1673 TaxID=3032595 RepID=UPI0023D9E401|nr:methyltransferase [Aliiglaciecola sp. CAU 1673]MDF2176836.1 methyltransferase [Aliiglaciecola sp. CAU 1673]
MKVGTDGILLGSWVETGAAEQILDIGTGSGLLALMLAQKSRSSSRITAVEIDNKAAQQAQDNVKRSPWSDKIRILCQPVQAMDSQSQFDLIVSNPPYYKAGQQFDPARETARHDGALTLPQLAQRVSQLLTPNGRFCCVLPVDGAEVLSKVFKGFGIWPDRQCLVSTVEGKPPSRVLLQFARGQQHMASEFLFIRDQQGCYSDLYRQLCQAYYLNF